MKKYLLFYGESAYPTGGMESYEGDYNTIEEAKMAYDSARRSGADQWCDWFEIVDHKTMKVIESCGNSYMPYG